MIPYSRQEILKEDIDEVKKILRSDFLTQGPVVPSFENAVANYCNSSHAIAVNSGTSALHLACLALKLGKGDFLWTSPNTFPASANCALYCGANVDFVDIDPKTYNISIPALSSKLAKAEKIGKLPKVVVPVHFAGQPCDMLAIKKLSKKYGFKIIEDASHAIGASYNNNIKVGSCRHSDITVFSFHPVKIITTGEGGMALTNDDKISDHIRRLSTHGITRNKKLMESRPINEIWNYQQIELGLNYRMSDIHAALGLSQLNRLDEYVTIRQKIASRYNLKFLNSDLKIPWQRKNTYSSYHLYPICIPKKKIKKTQKDFFDVLKKNNIMPNVHYIPVHRHPYYEKLGFKSGDFPEAELFHRQAISLPIYPSLSEKKQDIVIKSIIQFLNYE
jgi:UDP-4-amino-4,6-dideoxy-N-acetyl-beta-L-altrosamine transaminase